MKKIILLLFIYIITITISNGQTITGIGADGGYKGPFERGFQWTQYCGNNPESWIRCSAWLDQQTGLLTMQIQLETDATFAGPKGQGIAFIYDNYGNLLQRVASTEVGMGGKPPGGAVQNTFQASFNCGPDVGNRASKVVVYTNYTGSSIQLWGVTLEAVKDAMGLVQQFAMFFF